VTTPLSELLAAVPALNDPNEPFTYEVDDDTIVGRWDIVKATSMYPDEVTHIDKLYKIVVELDEDDHTFDFDEKKTSTSASVDEEGSTSVQRASWASPRARSSASSSAGSTRPREASR
jgi:hypothetical protein